MKPAIRATSMRYFAVSTTARSLARGWAVGVGLVLALFAAAAPAQTVMVFAAASLKSALDEIDAAYEKQSGARVAASYAASSVLARQIASGAPADVFVSADTEWMDYVEKHGLVRPGTRTNLLRNEIVLIAPSASTVRLDIGPNFPLAAHLGSGRLAIADPDHVPAGKYGKAALEALGVWPQVSGRLARAENVRAALLFVSRGEAPFGIVYRTDAAADRNVRIVGTFPPGTHPPVVYPAALLAASRTPAAAKYFAFMKSPAALAAFSKHGFAPYSAKP